MKLTTYSYWIGGPSDGLSVYTFADKKTRDEALRDTLKFIFESEGLGEVEDLGETPDDEDVIEQELDDAGWTYGIDECVMGVPVLDEVSIALDDILSDDGPIIGEGWENPFVDQARNALKKLDELKS